MKRSFKDIKNILFEEGMLDVICDKETSPGLLARTIEIYCREFEWSYNMFIAIELLLNHKDPVVVEVTIYSAQDLFTNRSLIKIKECKNIINKINIISESEKTTPGVKEAAIEFCNECYIIGNI